MRVQFYKDGAFIEACELDYTPAIGWDFKLNGVIYTIKSIMLNLDTKIPTLWITLIPGVLVKRIKT